MENLQEIYETAYSKEWEIKKGKSPIRVIEHTDMTDDNSPVRKVYETEGNFFLCGFNSLYFFFKGTGRNLRKELKTQGIETSKKYEGGLRFRMKDIGNRGNGDYQIQTIAYRAVISYLNSEGYTVYLDSRLD